MHRLHWNLYIYTYISVYPDPQTNFSDVQSERVARRYARIPFKHTYTLSSDVCACLYIDQVQQQLIIHTASIEISWYSFFFFFFFVYSFWDHLKSVQLASGILEIFSHLQSIEFVYLCVSQLLTNINTHTHDLKHTLHISFI